MMNTRIQTAQTQSLGRKLLRKIPVTVATSLFMVGSFFGQSAQAQSIRSLNAGEEAWITYNLSEGSYTILANSPNSLGDVNIEFYDSSYNLVGSSRRFGTDRLLINVHRGGAFHIKYRMNTCINFLGPCAVSIDVLHS